MLKKVATNTFLYAIGPQIPKIFGFFLLPVFTRYLTAQDYGLAGIIYAYTGLLGGIGDLGLHVRLANIYFKSPNRWINPWKQLFGFLSLWSVLVTILQTLLLLWALPSEIGSNKFIILLLLGINSLFFGTTINFCYKIFQFSEKAGAVTLISVVAGISTLLVNYITIVHFRTGYVGWFISTCVASFIQFAFCAYYLFGKLRLFPEFNFKKRYLMSTLKITLPLVPHNYSTYILDSSDRFLLDRLKVNISEIGKYNFAYIFASYLDFFINSLGTALSPTMARIYFSKASDRLQQLKILIIACQVLFFFLVFNAGMWLKEFLGFFISNKDLRGTYPLAIIIMVAYTYRPLYWYVNVILTYNNKTGSLWKVTFTAAVLNIILNIILIPYFSIYATAFSTLFSFLFIAFYGFFLKDFRNNNAIRFNLIVWFTGFIGLLMVCIFCMNSPLKVKIAVTLLINTLFGFSFSYYYKKMRLFRI